MMIKHVSKEKESDVIRDFFEPVMKNKYFHLHEPLDPQKIIQEISKYDFGFMISYFRHSNDVEPFFTTGNKIASYLEAGIPFIYEDSLKSVDKIMSSYDLGFSFNDSNLDILKKKLDSYDNDELNKKVEIARKDFDMDNNFLRLENFLEEVKRGFYGSGL